MDRHGPVASIGDDAQPVAAVEFPGLGGDIRGGKAQVEVARQDAAAVLRQHRPVPVPVEPVDQRPVEAGDVADVIRQELAEIIDGPGGVQVLHESAQPGREGVEAGIAGQVVRLLQFQHDEIVDPVGGDLVALPGGAGSEGHGAQIGGTVLWGFPVEIAPHQDGELRERPVEAGARGRGRRRVLAGLDDGEVRERQGEQEPVRLHAAHDVDGLPVADREVDRPGSAVACLIQSGFQSRSIPVRTGPGVLPAGAMRRNRSKGPICTAAGCSRSTKRGAAIAGPCEALRRRIRQAWAVISSRTMLCCNLCIVARSSKVRRL